MLAEEKIQDLRIRRTHKLLVDALKSLLTEQSFDEIHITDICERAMIHRTTFYKHFLDKYDLLSFALKDLQLSFEEKSKPMEDFSDEKEYFLNLFHQTLEYISDHKKMYLIGLKHLKNDSAIKILYSSVTENIHAKLESCRKKGTVYKVPTELIAEFYVGALFSIADWWIDKEMPVSMEKLVEYANLMIANEKFVLKK